VDSSTTAPIRQSRPIDGAVTLDAFTYLIEARWRQSPASDSDLGGLSHKVERRIDATRGLFISMAGFRPEAVDLYRRPKNNRLVLLDGADVTLILEGRIDFVEALREKVRAASVQGDPFVPLWTL
jgi:Restriction endonuclease